MQKDQGYRAKMKPPQKILQNAGLLSKTEVSFNINLMSTKKCSDESDQKLHVIFQRCDVYATEKKVQL